MKNLGALFFFVIAFSSCFDLQLPPQPGVGAPGVITGRVVWQRPGRITAEGASGASIFLLGSNVAVATNGDGRFVLDGVTRSEGTLLIRFDADRDGLAERQRTFSLVEIGAARGRTISLGDVSMSQPALVEGAVLRGDVLDGRGHGGTPVFIPGLPLATFTTADATFALEGVVEGPVQLAAVRAGYEAWLSSPIEVRGGEALRLTPATLVPTRAAMSGVLRGRVVSLDGVGLSGVTVRAGSASTQSDADGAWRFTALPVDRYDVLFTANGRLPAALFNVLVAGPDELVMPDVVLGEGLSGTTPVLVSQIAMESDAGTTDAGTTDAGTDAGAPDSVTIGTGAMPTPLMMGVNDTLGLQGRPSLGAVPVSWDWKAMPLGRVTFDSPTLQNPTITAVGVGSFTITVRMTTATGMVTHSINGTVAAAPDASVFTVSTNAILPFDLDVGSSKTVTASVAPSPSGTPIFAWTTRNPAVVSLGTPGSASVLVQATSPGLFDLDLVATVDGTTHNLTVSGRVRAPDAGTPDAGTPDAGNDGGSFITGSGMTPLSLWVETPDFVASASAPVLNGASGTLRINQARGRISVLFDRPPDASVTFSVPSVVLGDGGVRTIPAMTFPGPPELRFTEKTMVTGTPNDLQPALAWAPTGYVVAGRLVSASGCSTGCFAAWDADGGAEAAFPAQPNGPGNWHRGEAVGANVFGWQSLNQLYQRSPTGAWTTINNAPGALFADGLTVRSMGPYGGTTLSLYDFSGGSWTANGTAGTTNNGIIASMAVATRETPNRLLVAGVSSSGSVNVFERATDGTTWTQPGGLSLVMSAQRAFVAATPAGDFLAINLSGAPTLYSRLPNGNWNAMTLSFTPGTLVLDLVSVGNRGYLLTLETGGTPTLTRLEVGGLSGEVLPLTTPPCRVESGEMATSDFGDLAIAWSLNCSGMHSLVVREVTP